MSNNIAQLIHYLDPTVVLPDNLAEQRLLLRALMNIRPPQAETAAFWQWQDEILQQQLAEKGIVGLADLAPIEPNIYLWQGDITRLKVGAIVNAANSQLLGCFQPLHRCIDNAIHSQAGLQLRHACAELMQRQGHLEPTGQAKITPAYNLPCDYVIHTVGPIIHGELTEQDCKLLAQCYRLCLALAVENSIQSIAFCCISTGEFRFPNQAAAEIAVREVRRFLTYNPSIKVIFNVFKDIDLAIYQDLLGEQK